jgi:hypothetical protein
LFAVIESITGLLDRRSFEDAYRIRKGNTVQTDVAPVLGFIPTIAHMVYLRNVNTAKGFSERRTIRKLAVKDQPEM